MKTSLRLILNGTFDKFPNLRMILGHLGEYFPFILERVDNRFVRHSANPLIQTLKFSDNSFSKLVILF